MSEFWSTSTFAKETLPGWLCEVASCSKTGAMALQGPHHVAVKSVTTYVFADRSFENWADEVMVLILDMVARSGQIWWCLILIAVLVRASVLLGVVESLVVVNGEFFCVVVLVVVSWSLSERGSGMRRRKCPS